MGLGYALTEELRLRERHAGRRFKLRDIGVLRARDMPEIEVILVEEPEPEGPFGAKGVGEIGLVPTAAAVAGALEAFDGVRRYTLPMKDSPAARAMSVGRIRTRCMSGAGRRQRAHAPLQRPRAARHAGALARAAELPRDPRARLVAARSRARRAVAARGARGSTSPRRCVMAPTVLVDHHESPTFIEGSLDVLADACQELGMPRRALLRRDRAQRRPRRGEARPGRVPPLHPRRTAARWSAASSACTRRSRCPTTRSARRATCAASCDTVVHVHVAEDRADVDDARPARLRGPARAAARARRAARRVDPRARRAPRRRRRCGTPTRSAAGSCRTRGRTATTRSAIRAPSPERARGARHRRLRVGHARGNGGAVARKRGCTARTPASSDAARPEDRRSSRKSAGFPRPPAVPDISDELMNEIRAEAREAAAILWQRMADL